MARFVCFGEILLRLTAPGRELMLQTPRLDVHYGGAEANVAVSLARFGHDARMVSFVPDNTLGEAATNELRRYGVDTRHVDLAAGRMGLYFLTPGAGQRPADIVYDRLLSAFASVRAQATDWKSALAGADWFHVSGVTPALNAAAADRALAGMRSARAAGVKVSFDANFRAKLWEARADDPRETLDAFFKEADIMFADARDIALVTGESPASSAEAARIAFDRYPNLQRVACTERKVISADHHDLSAYMHTRSAHFRAATQSVTGIVDRIGGGDAFAAGLLHCLATGAVDESALAFALAAACLKHYIPGDFNLSTVDDVTFYLSNSGSDVRR
ncbi:MAG: PfkB family carbohydrate kinase [Hyphomonadaceae bacterium]